MPANYLSAGDLDRRVTLQARSTSMDSFGQQLTTWTVAFDAWARVTPLTGRELLAAQAIVPETTHEVVIRYRASTSPGMRVVYAGRVLDVRAVLDEDSAHVQQQLLCSEGLTQG